MKSKDINLKCIVCGKDLKYINNGDYRPEQDMWAGAGVHNFIPGFGSAYNCHCFVVGVCDNCISKKLEDRSIIQTW